MFNPVKVGLAWTYVVISLSSQIFCTTRKVIDCVLLFIHKCKCHIIVCRQFKKFWEASKCSDEVNKIKMSSA